MRRALEWGVRTGKLFALLALIITAWLMYDALTSPQYVVRTVAAEGVTALTVEDIAAITGVNGDSLWLVRADEIEARVGQSPYVEAVHARVELPDRVVVTVRERRPEVRWMHNGVSYAVTWDGLILAATAPESSPAADVPAESPPAESPPAAQPEGAGEISEPVPALVIPGQEEPPAGEAPLEEQPAESPPEGDEAEQPPEEAAAEAAPAQPGVSQLMIVDTTPNRELKPGDKVDPDALEVARRVTLRAHELPAPIQRIEWDAGLGISLIVADGKQAVIGRSERLDEKLAILAQLLWDSTPFTYLDLRPTTPYYR